MKRREARRQRDREQLPQTLSALVALVPADSDARKFLESRYGSIAPVPGNDGDGDSVIAGEGLQKLVEALGEGCPDGAMDLVRVARRVPRSQSTVESIQIAELCFALSQATGPVGVHERRRTAGAQSTPLDEDCALLQYYKGRRFHAIVRGEDPSSPAARAKGSTAEEDVEMTAEWKAFVSSAETALPMSLRVHSSERALERVALQTLAEKATHDVVTPVTALPPSARLYSCSNAAYHANPRAEYVCRTLHAASAVSFQEVVSAIPVLALGVEPHHRVLDMCAAPGSKTLQALDDMLKLGWSSDAVRRGVMVANEKDRVKAMQTLPARLKRFHAPNVMSTRCDAVQWPRLFMTEAKAAGETAETAPPPVEQRFDRIICDVPCSGDGTIRKEPSVAATWSAGYVKSLVLTQRALLRRGLDLLDDGGVLVYSTCSINPKEDEEVVCAALELFGDAVELLDVNAVLAAKGAVLHSKGGIRSPNVEGLQQPVLPSGFDGDKVLRVLPHRDNTGGFFVALFRKVRQLDTTPPTAIRHKLNQWTKGKLWAPVTVDDPVWTGIAAFYGFDHLDKRSFSYYPASSLAASRSCTSSSNGVCDEEASNGLVPLYHLNPNGGPSRRIVLATPMLSSMLFDTRPYKGPGVELVCVGARAFEAYDGKFLSQSACRWRAVVESASYLAERFTRRKMHFSASTHRAMLEELLRNGFVHVREHWRAILSDPRTSVLNSATRDVAFPFVKEGPLKELLAAMVPPHTSNSNSNSGSGAVDSETALKVSGLLGTELAVGGILIALTRNDDPAAGEEEPWYLSATLSGNKLELAVDASVRTYGLMAYLDIYESAIKPTGDGAATAAAAAAARAVAE